MRPSRRRHQCTWSYPWSGPYKVWGPPTCGDIYIERDLWLFVIIFVYKFDQIIKDFFQWILQNIFSWFLHWHPYPTCWPLLRYEVVFIWYISFWEETTLITSFQVAVFDSVLRGDRRIACTGEGYRETYNHLLTGEIPGHQSKHSSLGKDHLKIKSHGHLSGTRGKARQLQI